jgi:hypothetical protein
MKPSRVLPGAIVVGSLAVASLFASAPASAATLPAGAKITVIDQADDQYYNVNPADAVATAVGTPTGIDQWVSGVDVDDAGLGYATATEYYYDGEIEIDAVEDQAAALVPFGFLPDGGWIYRADANTGMLTDGKPVIIDLLGPEDVQALECSAIDYSKGVILAVCYTGGSYEYDAMWIGTVDFSSDPEAAILTPLTSVPAGEGFIHISAIALDPVTGVLHGFSDGWNAASYTITLDDSYPEFIEYLEDYEVWGADFDRDGQLWLSVTDMPEPAGRAANPSFMSLATFDFEAEQPVVVDVFSSDDPYFIEQPEALTVWGVLAATGSAASPIAPAIAAAGVLLLGAILAAGTMVLRRRSAEV